MSKHPLGLVPLCNPKDLRDALSDPTLPNLAALLQKFPAASREPLDPRLLQRPLSFFQVDIERQRLHLACDGTAASAPSPKAPDASAASATAPTQAADQIEHVPEQIDHAQAVTWAYQPEIDKVASFLQAGLSVLVQCDKLNTAFLYGEMARRALRRPVLLEVDEDAPKGLLDGGNGKLKRLRELCADLKDGDVLVVPHLDLMAAGDGNLSKEAREIVELLFSAGERLLLAFADRSMKLPTVLTNRFAVHLEISGLPRTVQIDKQRTLPLGKALVSASEAACFSGFDAEGLYKNVAGMSPVRLRQAITYACREEARDGAVPVERLYQAIRAFKAQTSANFTVPDVGFEQIGGYEDVKRRMEEVLAIMLGHHALPSEALRRELIPKGFIFYGPPGTGKTLFAKAVANRLNATIQVVSGPEVTDMYVGESERKVRALFAEARRNAPSVLVFDEFDAIATTRSNRDDGGSRAGNALVAQILTEMDGFRPEVPVLVIGTTNRLDIIDDALLRPSRFQAIEIALPNEAARHAIARVHARHFGLDLDETLLRVIAEATAHFNGDEIRSIFREACVGLRCHQPPLAADARRYGFLVGRLRQSAETRATTHSMRGSTLLLTRHRERDNESSGMMALDGEEEKP